MALRLGLFLLLLASAMVVESSSLDYSFDKYGVASFASMADRGLNVGDLISYDEETMLTTESERRILAQAKKYISYGALKKNSTPCKKRGSSYYNCNSRQKANPYKRGCSKITNCYRYTNI